MKYFTPDVIERGNSDDDDIADAVEEEWERAIVRYHRRLQKILADLPKGVQQFRADRVCLHDADLLGIGREEDRLIMVLQPEPPAQTMVVLTFTLDGDPVIDTQALPGRDKGTHDSHWMYEEWDLDRQKRPIFEVLFNHGWSVKLRFRDFQYAIAERLYPVPRARVDPAVPPAPAPLSKPA